MKKRLIIIVVLVAVLSGLIAVVPAMATAPSSLPTGYTLPSDLDTTGKYLLLWRDSSSIYKCIQLIKDSAATALVVYDSGSPWVIEANNIVGGTAIGAIYVWTSSDCKTWGTKTRYTTSSFDNSVDKILYSNHDIYRYIANTVFFSTPLTSLQLLHQAQQNSLQTLLQQVFSTASLISGKGLLILAALLGISLIIFSVRRAGGI